MAALSRVKPSPAAIHHLLAAAPPTYLPRHLPLSQFSHFSTSVSSAASQPQLDPDYYYLDDEDNSSLPNLNKFSSPSSSQNVVRAAYDFDTWRPDRGGRWAMIGHNRGRCIFSEKLSKLLEVPRISITSLVRHDLSPRSSLYKQIANAVDQGTVVSEDVVFGLLAKRLEDGYYQGEMGFLDGIPRTQVQAEILDQLVDIDLVVNFKCVDKDIQDNHASRILSQNMALEDYYKKRKKLLNFQVCSVAGETWEGLLAALHLQYVTAVHGQLPSEPS